MTKEQKRTKLCPALSPEAREKQLISLAMDRAEEKLMNGTASSQLITHFLKLGSERERLEREHLAKENELITAKTKALADSADMAMLCENAINAMVGYSGNGDIDEDED